MSYTCFIIIDYDENYLNYIIILNTIINNLHLIKNKLNTHNRLNEWPICRIFKIKLDNYFDLVK